MNQNKLTYSQISNQRTPILETFTEKPENGPY